MSIDYCGAFVTGSRVMQQEIVMADESRYEGTSSTLSLADIGRQLRMHVSGIFQERPVNTTVAQSRIDMYVNLDKRDSLLNWIGEKFSPSLVPRQSLPKAPDPRPFVGGNTSIPLTGVPSVEFLTESALIQIPKWKLEAENIRTFIDVERDNVHGTQYHIGLRLTRRSPVARITKELDLYPLKGEFMLSLKELGVLYSYIHHWPP
jgi:hypothetical protein